MIKTEKLYKREFVRALVLYDEEGGITPQSIVVNDETYTIDKVLSSYLAACQKAGGIGTCYDCRIRGQTAKLWFDEKRWWVASKPER